MKTKKGLYFIVFLFLVGTHTLRAFGPSDNTFSFTNEIGSAIDLFRDNRDFSIIDEVRGEDNCHDLTFHSPWDDRTYSVYIWKHIYSDTYEIKSSFESDVANFLATTNIRKYKLTNVERRSDGREHVKFQCKNLVQKMITDQNMKNIK